MNPDMPELLSEVRNLSWLFYAYGLGVGLLFVYIFQISRRERALRRRIADLQATVDDRWKK